jgi:tetratricopeptide (TPR) repeat protein
MCDVFLSHNSQDKPFVEALAKRLEDEAGLSVWLDKWELIPGEPWQEALEAALDQCQTYVVCLGRSGLGPWHNEELRLALRQRVANKNRRVIPVLLPGSQPDALKEAPAFLSGLLAVDFRQGLEDQEAFRRLVAGIKGRSPGRGEEQAGRDRQKLVELPQEIPEPAPLPTGSRIVHKPNPRFVGRKADLKALAEALKAGETMAIGQVAAATGLGGIGKTQLASEFVHRYGQYFSGGVFWLSFAEGTAIPAEVAACGRRDYLNLAPDFDELDLPTQVRLVKSAWRSPEPRLLVFDNCEEETLLAQWQPASGGCRVLVTSRRGHWARDLGGQALPLGLLSLTESVDLLQKHRPALGRAEAEAIAEEVGRLPLALHLAGSFLNRYQHTMTPGAYLKQLRDKSLLDHASLQGRGTTFSLTGHDLHVGRTFALSYDRLERADETDALALTLLGRAACFAPGEPIPRTLLAATIETEGDEEEAGFQREDALRRLVELGLLDVEEEGALLIHRLLAAFVERAEPEPAARQAVEKALLAEAIRLNKAGYPAPLLAWQPHLQAVTNIAQERGDELGAKLGDALGTHLGMVADYHGARAAYERALKIDEAAYGPDHPNVATYVNNLGLVLQALGELAEARAAFERALKIGEAVYGPDHPNVATYVNNLGLVLKDLGELAEARAAFERALTIFEQVLGPGASLHANCREKSDPGR